MSALTQLKIINSDVAVTEEQFPSVGESEIAFLQQRVASSSQGRTRLCMHKTNDDRQHEMFITLARSTYLRPSWHVGKDESLHVLNGSARYVFFDEDGEILDIVHLGPYGSDHQFYCRIDSMTQHAIVLHSDRLDIHETTAGPFRREDTVFSPWSPADDDLAGREAFLREITQTPPSPRPLLKMTRQGQEVFVADDKIVSVGRKEMDFLKDTVPTTDRKRVRLCAHKDTENSLHEMFVVYTDMTYVKPNKHINKDESLHILEGEADFIFFDENGSVIAAVPLGAYGSGRQFYIRVPAFIYHTIVMKSERLVIHEATPGPFRREDTVWAPWAPMETDGEAVSRFMTDITAAAQRFL